MTKWHVVVDKYCSYPDDPDAAVWTLSRDSNETGWETDSGYSGYGLLKADAEELANAANKVAELEDNMFEAMNHAVKYWKENGMKTDDQLGIVSLILAVGLGLTKKVGG